MYAKFGSLSFYVFNYYNILFIGIFCQAIMHKKEFDQACQSDLLKRILKNFSLHLSEHYFIYNDF
jgi:hypothetical protein